ncbi:hypothetical protein ACTXT7_003120 [Hymenolepis weldensis]
MHAYSDLKESYLQSDELEDLSIETQMELFETFVEPVLLYGLFTIVYRKVDDDKLKAIQNTARGIKLDVYSRQQMSVKVLAEKVV